MKTLNIRRKRGVSSGLAVAIIVLLAVAGVGGYYVLKGFIPSSLGGGSQSMSSSGSTSTSQTTTGSGNTNGLEDFSGIFQWSSSSNMSGLDLVERASGNFSVTIDLSNDTGQGIGLGQTTIEWSGQCTGQNSSGYNFTVSAVLLPTATGTNLSISFGPANPAGSTLLRTCQGYPSSSESWSWVAVGAPSGISITPGQTIEGTNTFDFGNVAYAITLLKN
jgi:hypothetical protein